MTAAVRTAAATIMEIETKMGGEETDESAEGENCGQAHRGGMSEVLSHVYAVRRSSSCCLRKSTLINASGSHPSSPTSG